MDNTSSFATKFLSRLQRIDPEQIESFLTNLVKEKDFQRAIFDSLLEGVVVANAQSRVVLVNEAARALLGLGKRKSTGEQLRKLLRARALQQMAEEFALNPEPIDQREIRVRTPEPRIYSASVVPILDSGGKFTHSIWIISDQTDIHRRAQERHQVESIRALSTLTAGIAHEVKNPLNSLNIHAQLIAKAAAGFSLEHPDSPDLDRLRRSTDVLLEEISRLTRIVDQFIKAVRPTRLNVKPTNVNEVVDAVSELIEPACKERNIHLVSDLDPTLPLVRADPEQLLQAVLNVAKNAMEAIDKPEGRIVLRTVARGHHLFIEVEDNGCGIPEEDRLRIFEPYHTTKFDGTGLGLMIVFRIIRAHGGEIGLDSEVGRGTTFRLVIPLDEPNIRLLADDAGSTSNSVSDVVQLPPT